MLYRLLIVAATVIWGSSFVIVKNTTDAVAPAWILAFRFLVAAVLLALVFLKRRKLYLERSHVACGCLFGVAIFLAYYAQTVGIVYTTPGRNAFLTALYCVMVPFFAWFSQRKRPNRYNISAAVLALAGVGLISLTDVGGFELNIGDGLTIVGAVFYAVHICLVARFSEGRDIFVLTMWQFFAAGMCSVIVGFATSPMPEWASLGADTMTSLLYLAIGCSAVALLFQNIGQAHLPPSSAALLLSLESVFGVVFSVALGAEVLTLRILAGFMLIFVAIVVSETQLEFLRKK